MQWNEASRWHEAVPKHLPHHLSDQNTVPVQRIYRAGGDCLAWPAAHYGLSHRSFLCEKWNRESVTVFKINWRYGGRCVIVGRMINWCLDDELWIHPGFLAAARHIDGIGNEGNNEGRFRRMWNGRNNRNICGSLQLEYNWDHMSFSSLKPSLTILALWKMRHIYLLL